jgi:hypothetical protein
MNPRRVETSNQRCSVSDFTLGIYNCFAPGASRPVLELAETSDVRY